MSEEKSIQNYEFFVSKTLDFFHNWFYNVNILDIMMQSDYDCV